MTEPDSGNAKKNAPRFSRRFKRAGAAALLATTAAAGGFGAVFWTASAPVPLTVHEADAAKSLFGLHFETGDIRKKYTLPWAGTLMDNRNAMVPLSQHRIYFFTRSLKDVDDLTQSTPGHFRLFMHEMTHIWQHRGNWAPICQTYEYKLTAKSRFTDFCNEQQADIVGNYALAFLNPNSRSAVRQIGDGVPRIEGRENLARVVERRFKQARYSRERIATHYQRVANCITSYKIEFNSKSKPDQEQTATIDRCFNNPADRAAATTDTPPAPPRLPAARR